MLETKKIAIGFILVAIGYITIKLIMKKKIEKEYEIALKEFKLRKERRINMRGLFFINGKCFESKDMNVTGKAILIESEKDYISINKIKILSGKIGEEEDRVLFDNIKEVEFKIGNGCRNRAVSIHPKWEGANRIFLYELDLIIKGEKEIILSTGEIRENYKRLIEIFEKKNIKIIDEMNIGKLLEEYKEDKNLAEYFIENNIGYDKKDIEKIGMEINKKIYGEEE